MSAPGYDDLLRRVEALERRRCGACEVLCKLALWLIGLFIAVPIVVGILLGVMDAIT